MLLPNKDDFAGVRSNELIIRCCCNLNLIDTIRYLYRHCWWKVDFHRSSFLPTTQNLWPFRCINTHKCCIFSWTRLAVRAWCCHVWQWVKTYIAYLPHALVSGRWPTSGEKIAESNGASVGLLCDYSDASFGVDPVSSWKQFFNSNVCLSNVLPQWMKSAAVSWQKLWQAILMNRSPWASTTQYQFSLLFPW